MRHTLLILLSLVLAGCTSQRPASIPLGRTFGPSAPSRAAAYAGDPPGERNGTLPAAANAQENRPTGHSLATTPRAALRAYALAYGNWNATTLRAHELYLAELAVGAARLTADQTAASVSTDPQLALHQVHNEASIIAIAPIDDHNRGEWVVVTAERTTGLGPYAALPSTLHVTFAYVGRMPGGWAVSRWKPTD